MLLAIVVGAPLVFRGDQDKSVVIGDEGVTQRLVVYTPHNEQIMFEMSRGFNRYREANGQGLVEFDWRTSGGTSDLRRMVLDQYEGIAKTGNLDKGIGADLFFGGGEYEHNKLARGVQVEVNGEEVWQPVSVAPVIDEKVFAEVFPQATIGGENLYNRDRLWVGSVLASFGIVYNRDVVRELGIDEPRTWDDLATSKLKGWIALADPAHSGSIGATYNMIMRRKGWKEGWATLRRSFANARYFAMSAGQVPMDVSAGEAAAGMCIDFYGRYQAGQIGGDRLGYVDPKYMTSFTSDPISILRGSPNFDLANEFVNWLLSQEGQRLWQRKVGSEGGPIKYELRRLPVRRDMYVADEMRYWVDDVQPWRLAKPLPEGMPDMYFVIAPISHAMAIDIHDDLKAAWQVICDTNPADPRYQEMLALFDAMPQELTLQWADEELAENWADILEDETHPKYAEVAKTLNDFMGSLYQRWSKPDQLLKDRMAWTSYFRGHYRKIVALAGRE